MKPAEAISLQTTDLRAKVREEISSIDSFDDLETQQQREALSWLDSGEEFCRIAKPATPPRHLVSYFVCLAGSSVLLVDHKKAMLWLPPGGHVEPNEHPRDTVIREAREELGIDATFIDNRPFFISSMETVGLTAGHVDVCLWYLLSVDKGRLLNWDKDEFVGIRWFEFDQVPRDRCDRHMPRFLQKVERRKS